MEEEIITPEEETFDYSKLRYILDDNGYICHASVGGFIVCDLGTCTEYNGKVPAGYGTIDEWYDKQIITKKLNAWKIVDGDLVYDPNRDYELTLQYEQDEKNYKNVTHKELGLTTSEQEKAYNDLFPSNSSSSGEIVTVDSYVGDLSVDKVRIDAINQVISGLIELEFIGNNFLPNTATSNSNNGINYNVVKEKKIIVSGVATAKSTFNLAGTDTSIKKILTFKRNTNYYLSGINENINVEFYYYDGTDRTLVGTFNNGSITFDTDTPVTQVVLSIDSGIAINETIEPMLSLGDTETTYEAYKNNSTLINLDGKTLTLKDILELEDNQAFLWKPERAINLGDIVMPRTYGPITHAYSHQQVTLSFVYKDSRNIDIQKINLKGLIQTMEIENTYNFSEADCNKVWQYMLGEIELTREETELYDINGDGKVSHSDYEVMLGMKDGEIPATIKGTLEINTTSSQRTLLLRDEENNISTSIGLNGITTPSLTIGGVPINNAITYSENETIIGTWIDGKKLYRRVIYCGALPNNTIKNVETGFKAGEIFITNFGGVTSNGTTQYSLPYIHPGTLGKSVSIYADVTDGNIVIALRTGEDRRAHNAWVIIEYTKANENSGTDTPVADIVKTISAIGSKSHHKFTLQVNEDSTSGNGSSMSFTFKLSPVATTYQWANWTRPDQTISYTITIGGNTFTGTIPQYDGKSTVILKSDSGIMIEHDADGSKTINIGFAVIDTTGVTYTTGNASASDTMVLTKTK